MGTENVVPPNLPVAPVDYQQRYQDQFANVLRLFFTRLTSKVNAPVPHGSFYDTTTQTNPVASAVNLMRLNSVYGSNNDTQYAIKKNTDRIYITQAGVYNIAFSAQLDKTGGGADNVFIWIRVNGQNVAHSASKVVINGPNDEVVAAWNWVLTLADKDYIELAWQSPDTQVVLLAVAATGNIPEIPSVILTVTWVSAVNQL
jgi:hypothetical protein